MNTVIQRVKWLSFFLIYWLACSVNAAKIDVSVDRNPVNANESFQIQFTTNESPDETPDFSVLEQSFIILNQSQSSQLSWVNGKSAKIIRWTLNVIAKKTGTVIIPIVTFGRDSSEPLTIEVLKQDDNALNTQDDLFLEVEATPQTPYLQSQVLYTLRLYRKVDITQAQLTEPELTDAVIAKLDQDHNYETKVKGVAYSVTERKYVIFPQKSGAMTIKPLILTAETVVNSSSFFNSTQTKRVTSKEVKLQVKPIPTSFTGSHWLSAEQLELRQEWSGDFAQMKVGEPLTRTLSLQAKAATVSALPELNSGKLDSQIKIYPDQPVLKEQKINDGLLALREEKIAFIASKEGSYTLPEIKIPWFNTKTNKMEIATIPETTITVLANAEATRSTPTIDNNNQAVQTTHPIMSDSETPASSTWQWISLSLALGWLMTVFYFLTQRSTTKPEPITTDNKEEYSLNVSIAQLKKACFENKPIDAKNALLAWGASKFAATSLGTIAEQCDARLRDEILQLNQVLYSKETPSWTGKKLFQAFIENKARANMTTNQQANGLEPLFRL